MVRFLLPRSLVAFLSFPLFLMTDFQAVWSLGRIDSLRVAVKKGKRGGIVVFEVEERR